VNVTGLQLGIFDLIALLLIALGALRGFFKRLSGILPGTISLAVVAGAGWAAFVPLGAYVAEKTGMSGLHARVAAFAATALVAYIALRIIRAALGRIMKVTFAEGFDRWAGLIAGALHATVIVAVAFCAALLIPGDNLHTRITEDSVIGSAIAGWLPQVTDQAQSLLQEAEDWEAPPEDAGP
jgi:uncharacterized membrane protein required for colicin V production